jgi:hypothetical protein
LSFVVQYPILLMGCTPSAQKKSHPCIFPLYDDHGHSPSTSCGIKLMNKQKIKSSVSTDKPSKLKKAVHPASQPAKQKEKLARPTTGNDSRAPDHPSKSSKSEQKAVIQDDRFKHVHSDPRFQRLPNQSRKFKVDKRFKGMFEDKEFQMNYIVDKHGRRIEQTGKDDIKKYYQLGEEASDEEDPQHESVAAPQFQPLLTSSSSDEDDSEEDENSEAEEVEDIQIVPREEATARLAVVNMEWDRVKAVDLLVVFN